MWYKITTISICSTFFSLQLELLMTCWWGCRKLNKLSRMSIWCAFNSVSDIHRYFENCKWVCLQCPELFPINIHIHLAHNWWQKYKEKIMIRMGVFLVLFRFLLNWSMSLYSRYNFLSLVAVIIFKSSKFIHGLL